MAALDMRDIMEAIRKGDRLAWNELVTRFQRRVFAAALAVMKDPDDADEITQEVFVRLHSNIDRIRDANAIPAWLVRVSANLARDRMRFRNIRRWFSAKREDVENLASHVSSPEAAAARNEMREMIELWSDAKLSAKERLVVQLRIGEEMTFGEIADALQMSASTAKTHFSRAKAKIEPFVRKLEGEGRHE